MMRLSLATRLSLFILAVCGCVLVLAGVGMLGYTYHRERDAVRRLQEEIRAAHLPGITAAAWDLSRTRTEEALRALASLRHVERVRLVQPEGVWTLGDSLASILDRVEYPLVHPLGGHIGTVTVEFSRASVWHAVQGEARTLVAYFALVIAVAAVSVLVVFRVAVTRHLDALARYTRSLTLDTLDREFAFQRPPPAQGGDELDNLLDAIRQMRHTVQGQIQGRREAEENLRRTEQNYQEVFNATGDALFIHDVEGRLVDVNETMLRMFSCTREQALELGAVGLSSGEPPYDEAHLREHLRLALERGAHLFEWQARRVGGGTFWVEISVKAAPLHGRPHIIASVRDIHLRKEMEEQLHHSRRLDAVGQLAGGVAHDFNNMLAGIMGAAELLEQLPGCRDPEARELTGMILQSGSRAADLTRKLLAFSRKGKIESTAIDAHDSVEGAVAILRHTLHKKVAIVQELTASRSRVVGDPSALQNAILNLGINAGHAMPEGGELRVSSRVRFLDEDACRASRFQLKPGGYLELEVRDTGCGIAPDNLPHIFDPFFTTKAQGEGTGLGLAAVYGTMVSHQGAVDVASELGRGTAFRLLLPLSDQEKALPAAPGLPVTGSGRILVVDDEAVIRGTACLLLRNFGYEVLSAATGREALALLEDPGHGVDLVLLDMVMPEMDGRECFQHLRERHPDLRILLSSGFTRDVDLEALLRQGLRGFLPKPWRAEELAAAVARALDRPGVA